MLLGIFTDKENDAIVCPFLIIYIVFLYCIYLKRKS